MDGRSEGRVLPSARATRSWWRRGTWLLAAVAAAALAGGATARAGAVHAPVFDDGSLTGRWGFAAAGTVVPPAVPDAVPAAAAGTMVFDGRGGCRIADTVDVGGTVASRVSTSCRYSVGRDGRGTLTAVFPDEPSAVPLSFAIVGGGSAFRFIRADAVVASGVAERQRDR
jgi:hypothetical protein